MARTLFGEESIYTVTYSQNLALIYGMQKRFDDAREILQHSLDIMLRRGAPDSDVADSLRNLGDISRQDGIYEDAVVLHQKALAVAERAFGAASPRLSIYLNSLSQDFLAQGHYRESLPIQLRAMELWEKASGKNDAWLPLFLNPLGLDYYHLGDLTRAESVFRRALSIVQTVKGSDHADLVRPLRYLARLYHDQERYPESRDACLKALAILEKDYGQVNSYVAYTLMELAEPLIGMGEIDDAEKRLVRARDPAEST